MSFMRPISVLLGINCNNTEKTQQIVVSMEIHELYIWKMEIHELFGDVKCGVLFRV